MLSEVEMIIRLKVHVYVESESTETALQKAEEELVLINEGRCIAMGYSDPDVKSVLVVHKEWNQESSSVEM